MGQQCRPLITAGGTAEGSCQVINTNTSNGRAAPHRVCGTNTTTLVWINKQGCTPLKAAGCDTLYRSGRVCEVFPPVAAQCWRRVLLWTLQAHERSHRQQRACATLRREHQMRLLGCCKGGCRGQVHGQTWSPQATHTNPRARAHTHTHTGIGGAGGRTWRRVPPQSSPMERWEACATHTHVHHTDNESLHCVMH